MRRKITGLVAHIYHEYSVQALVPEEIKAELRIRTNLAGEQLILRVLLGAVPAATTSGLLCVETCEAHREGSGKCIAEKRGLICPNPRKSA
jgi:hypothetical protein